MSSATELVDVELLKLIDEKYPKYSNRFNQSTKLTDIQTWLRKEIGIMIWVEPIYYDGWNFACNVAYPDGSYFETEGNSWDFALENGIKETLKKINKNKTS